MLLLAIFILFLILLLTVKEDKSFIHPTTITCLIWLFCIVGYNIIDHDLYPLSDEFYGVLLLWVVPFFLFCKVSSIFAQTKKVYLARYRPDFVFAKWFILFFSFTALITLVIKFKEAQTFGLQDGLYASIRDLAISRARGDENPPSPLFVFFNRFAAMSPVICLIYLLNDFRRKYIWLFYAIAIAYIFSGATKGTILNCFLAIIVILEYKKKIKLSQVFVLFSFVLIAVILVHILRSSANTEDFDLVYFLYSYLFSPLTAFDSFILESGTNFQTPLNGGFVFGHFFNDEYPVYFENNNFVYVPSPTNVFTVLCSYYAAYGLFGISIAASLHGFFWGYVYTRSKWQEVYKILYASMFHILVFQFFYDYLITASLKGNILRMIFLFFIIYPMSYKKKLR